MANHDLTGAAYPGNYGITSEKLSDMVVKKRYIDTTVTPLTNGDNYDVLAYPDNCVITEVFCITETVEGAAQTVDVRDNASPTTTCINDHDLNTDNAIGSYTTRMFKASADSINLLANADLTVCKFWVGIVYIPLSTKD